MLLADAVSNEKLELSLVEITMNINHKISPRELLQAELIQLKKILSQQIIPALQGVFTPKLIALNQLENELASTEKQLVVLLLGGTGVGKSTFLNAIAGESIAKASNDIRGYTKQLNVYHYQNTSLKSLNIPMPFDHYAHDIEALEHILIIDAPDIDSVYPENQALVERFLPSVDIAIYVTSYQKYRNEHIHSFVKKLKGSHSFLFVMNQMDFIQKQSDSDLLMDDFRSLLETDFSAPQLFKISAKESIEKNLQSRLKLNSKIINNQASVSEIAQTDREKISQSCEQDFIRLMRYFYAEIHREELIRIKKKGIIGKVRQLILALFIDFNPTNQGQDLDQGQGLDQSLAVLAQRINQLLTQSILALEQQQQKLLKSHQEIFIELKAQLENELKLLIHLKRDQHCGGIYGLFLNGKKFGFGKMLQDLLNPQQTQAYQQMPIVIDFQRLEAFFLDRYIKVEQAYYLSLEQIRLGLSQISLLIPVAQHLTPISIKQVLFDLWRNESTQAIQAHHLPARKAWEIHFLPNLFTALMLVFMVKRWINGGEIGLFSLFIILSVIYGICQLQYLFFSKRDIEQFNIDIQLDAQYDQKRLFQLKEFQQSHQILTQLKQLQKQLDDLSLLDQKLDQQ